MTYNPPLIFGPIAPENNPPIHPEFFKPREYNIASIVNGQTTLVTTTLSHDYVVGQLVRLLIAQPFGARQFNEQTAYIINIPSNTSMILALDSSSFDLFVPNPTLSTTQPQVVAVGDVNTGHINLSPKYTHPDIPGSFRNTSPFPT
jgi:hypothetical protein